MKVLTIGFCLAVVASFSNGQSGDSGGEFGRIDAQRAAIAAERSRLEVGFLQEDAACYKKFAVNSCLGKVDARRREVMEDLRRKEFSLNDEERKIKGEEQIRRTQEKSSPENVQQAADERVKAAADSQGRLQREKDKQQERGKRKADENAAKAASAARLETRQNKIQARADKQALNAEEAAKFNQRQKEAQERQAQHEADRLKRVKPPAKPLPLPE